jgi:hypothetical protein
MFSALSASEPIPETALEQVEMLKSMLVDRATGGSPSETTFRQLRTELFNDPAVKDLLPRWAKTHRTLSEFWGFIQPQSPSYAGRREFLRTAFEPVIGRLEAVDNLPLDRSSVDILSQVDSGHVAAAWERALTRRDSDPEGAVTAARTLVETVCKHILSSCGVDGFDTFDLPKLYNLTAQQLEIAPSQHTEEAFKRILGSCSSVIEGIATLRNRLGDSHGKAPLAVRPAARHAKLAVNLAGTMAIFLIETFEARLNARRVS